VVGRAASVGFKDGLKQAGCRLRVDNGLTVIPIADVHANDGLWRTLSAAVGQLETFIGDAKISRKQSPADVHETLSKGVAWFDFH
jgi:hypothetical protein